MINLIYKSIEEMQSAFKGGFAIGKTRKEVEEAAEIFSNNQGFIFRGSGEAKFKLFNSAQLFWHKHALYNSGVSYFDFINGIFDENINSHQNIIPKYFENMGIPNYYYSLLSFFRHHHAPVPLLDFSRSFEVALFFAASGASDRDFSDDIGDYFACYSMAPNVQNFFNQPSLKFAPEIDSALNSLLTVDKSMERISEIQKSMIKDFPIFLIEQSSTGLNRFYIDSSFRIVNQRGLFLTNNSPDISLEEQIVEIVKKSDPNHPKANDWINVILIHKSLKQFALDYLNKRGINEEYIFPDPEKIVKSTLDRFLREEM